MNDRKCFSYDFFDHRNKFHRIKDTFQNWFQCYEDEQFGSPCPSPCPYDKRWNEISQNTQTVIFLLPAIYFSIEFAFRKQHYVFHLSRMMYDCKLIDSVHNSNLIHTHIMGTCLLVKIDINCRMLRYESHSLSSFIHKNEFQEVYICEPNIKMKWDCGLFETIWAIADTITEDVQSLSNPIRTKYCNHIEDMAWKNMILF